MEKMMKKPLLIKGDIMHHRFFPKKNHFDYKSTYISFRLSQLEDLKTTLFSLNKFNLFGFYNSDYGNKNQENIKNWSNQILEENGIKNIKDIILITHPRVLGYVFNPVSFWLCLNDKNQLIAVIAEVSNTCRQKHTYLCFKDNLSPIDSNEWLEAKKEFYVSPFMKIEGKYKFRFEYKSDSMNFYINYLVDNKIKLSTLLKCNFQEFNNKNLFLRFLKMPFFTFKTVILIHYQSAKLYFKSIEYYKYPKKLKKNITIAKNAK
jgi:uncharacterized protein